jgi:hypothetical protein
MKRICVLSLPRGVNNAGAGREGNSSAHLQYQKGTGTILPWRTQSAALFIPHPRFYR